MRLMKTDTYGIVEVGRIPSYAILSHRWMPEEITFKTHRPAALKDASFTSLSKSLHSSARKLRHACAIARKQGFSYIWIDTVCIDKSNSEELRTALNSMFKWYHDANVCYTYLNDVLYEQRGPEMFNSMQQQRLGRLSEWFERGWTLQELVAPRKMEFYDAGWTFMGTRNELAEFVGKAAKINPAYLNGKADFRNACNAVKMSWAAGRTTQMVEDIAYSLLGIFNVNLAPQYGEGVKAFLRLQNAIMSDFGTMDESLFAWQLPPNRELRCFRRGNTPGPKFAESQWGLLAPSPDCFAYSGDTLVDPRRVKLRINGGFHQNSQGITVTAGYGDGKNFLGLNKSSISLPLNCWKITREGSLETVVLELKGSSSKGWCRTDCETLRSSSRASIGSNWGQGAVGHHTFTVLQPQLRL